MLEVLEGQYIIFPLFQLNLLCLVFFSFQNYVLFILKGYFKMLSAVCLLFYQKFLSHFTVK